MKDTQQTMADITVNHARYSNTLTYVNQSSEYALILRGYLIDPTAQFLYHAIVANAIAIPAMTKNAGYTQNCHVRV